MNTTYLDVILEEKRSEVSELSKSNIISQYEASLPFLSAPRKFHESLKRHAPDSIRLIAEIKKASPSKGVIVKDFDPLSRAETYEKIGASAFSILTDEQFFQGHLSYLQLIKNQIQLPILRKDFIIDELQVYQSRLYGADAILLIVAALGDEQLYRLLRLAKTLQLAVLTEIHDETELSRAISVGADIIGINNRNLRDFSVNIDLSLKLKSKLPNGIVTVSESGLNCANDVRLMEEAGFDAVLIGEGLTKNLPLEESLFHYPWRFRE
ncbi:MAG: indole-3-glycerol phosphate synthase TrpC [Chloroherpetonaceae bacterium]|nr:indole-3-glycerol phosphate synthase TrpC [Chloroherpetonaceae bacterium]